MGYNIGSYIHGSDFVYILDFFVPKLKFKQCNSRHKMQIEILNFKPQTLKKFREVINTTSKYRSGPDLVKLFNQFGFNDNYETGFPSRWEYTDDKLSEMKFNDIKNLMESILHPINFINNEEQLHALIDELNKYLVHDNLMLTTNIYKTSFNPYNKHSYSLVLEIEINEEHILELWHKSNKRIKNKDFDGAITSARSMLETTLYHICTESNIEYNKKTEDILDVFKKVMDHFNMNTKQYDDEPNLKQILNGIKTTFIGFLSLRNNLSDAHGKDKVSYKPTARHSELAVNLAGSIAMFFYKTLKDKRIKN